MSVVSLSSSHISGESLHNVQSGISELDFPPPVQVPGEKSETHLEHAPRPLSPCASASPTTHKSEKNGLNQPFVLAQTCCWLSAFSIFGTLSRLGFIKLTTYPGSPLSGVIWANFAGCFIIGFLVEDIRLFSKLPKQQQEAKGPGNGDPENGNSQSYTSTTSIAINKAEIPLYLGLTTGYCGSLTSFSSYMLQAFLYLSNDLPAYQHPNKAYSFVSFSGYLIATLSLSMSALQAGAQLAVISHPVLPPIPSTLIKVLERTSFLWGLGLWTATIIMSVYIEKWRDVLFACIFSPLGTLLRFGVSKILNPRLKSFPLGTFAVNMIGTAVLAAVTIGQHGHNWTDSAIRVARCQALKGVTDGFCGCLTTVSTWVVEIKGLTRARSYIYCLATLVCGVAIMVFILGSYTWAQTLNQEQC